MRRVTKQRLLAGASTALLAAGVVASTSASAADRPGPDPKPRGQGLVVLNGRPLVKGVAEVPNRGCGVRLDFRGYGETKAHAKVLFVLRADALRGVVRKDVPKDVPREIPKDIPKDLRKGPLKVLVADEVPLGGGDQAHVYDLPLARLAAKPGVRVPVHLLVVAPGSVGGPVKRATLWVSDCATAPTPDPKPTPRPEPPKPQPTVTVTVKVPVPCDTAGTAPDECQVVNTDPAFTG